MLAFYHLVVCVPKTVIIVPFLHKNVILCYNGVTVGSDFVKERDFVTPNEKEELLQKIESLSPEGKANLILFLRSLRDKEQRTLPAADQIRTALK